MSSRNPGRLSEWYLLFAGIGYVLVGLSFGIGSSAFPGALLIPELGFLTSTAPSLTIAVCKRVATVSSSDCVANVVIGVGFLTILTLLLVKKVPSLIYVLLAISAYAFVNVMTNPPTEGGILSFLSLTNACLFLWAVREIYLPKKEKLPADCR